jgi:hypothetical protein
LENMVFSANLYGVEVVEYHLLTMGRKMSDLQA